MRPLKQKVSVTLDEDIVKRVKNLAEEEQRSFSQYVNLVLTEHLKNLDKTKPNTKQRCPNNYTIQPDVCGRNLHKFSVKINDASRNKCGK